MIMAQNDETSTAAQRIKGLPQLRSLCNRSAAAPSYRPDILVFASDSGFLHDESDFTNSIRLSLLAETATQVCERYQPRISDHTTLVEQNLFRSGSVKRRREGAICMISLLTATIV